MFHVCVQKFDLMENLEIFWKLNTAAIRFAEPLLRAVRARALPHWYLAACSSAARAAATDDAGRLCNGTPLERNAFSPRLLPADSACAADQTGEPATINQLGNLRR